MRDDFSRAKFMFLHSLDPKQTFKVGNMDAPGNPNFSTEWFQLRTGQLLAGRWPQNGAYISNGIN
jgi:hypothetical protein